MPDPLFRQAKRVAAERGFTLKELVTTAIIHELENQSREKARPRLPLPAVRVPANAPILHLTPEKIASADSEEELNRHYEIRRRR